MEDPIFGLIEQHRKHMASYPIGGTDEQDHDWDTALGTIVDALFGTPPITIAGALALVRYAKADSSFIADSNGVDPLTRRFLENLERMLQGLATSEVVCVPARPR